MEKEIDLEFVLQKLPQIKYYHIVGVWRSGTTLLSHVLGSHSRVVGMPEENLLLFLWRLFPDGNIPTHKIPYLVNKMQQIYRVRYFWGVDITTLHHILSQIGEELKILDVAKICSLISLPASLKDNFEIIIEKCPATTFYIEEVGRHNPHGKFIYIYRNPVDNTFSRVRRDIHTIKWKYSVAWWWCSFHEKALAFKEKHPDKILFVKYENLISNPQTEVQKICDFMGINFESDMLHPEKNFKKLTEKLIESWIDDPPPRLVDLLKAYETTEGLYLTIQKREKKKIPEDFKKIVEWICFPHMPEWGIYRKPTLNLKEKFLTGLGYALTRFLIWYNSWQ